MNDDMVRNALYDLNKRGVQGIRELFQAEHVTGSRGQANRCPVARYLSRTAGTDCVSVTGRFTGVDGSTYVNPDNVHGFILRFDRGEFPELVCGELR